MKNLILVTILAAASISYADDFAIVPEKVDCAVKVNGKLHKNFKFDKEVQYLISKVGNIETSIIPMETKGTIAVGASISDEANDIMAGPTLIDMNSPLEGNSKIVAMLKTAKDHVTVFCSLK